MMNLEKMALVIFNAKLILVLITKQIKKLIV
jgi:hypothetical protein